MRIEKNKDILCLKFSNVGSYDCIEEHMKILHRKGFVWFGKIGSQPTNKVLDKMINDNSKYILLREPKKIYLCEFETYQHVQPKKAEFPKYYLTDILPDREFSIWFKLLSITEVKERNILGSVVVKSSRNFVLETFHNSMASYFHATNIKDINL